MPHCVMRRPQAGAELGLEDPGELMPRSVERNLKMDDKCEKTKHKNQQTKKQQRYGEEFFDDKQSTCPVSGMTPAWEGR